MAATSDNGAETALDALCRLFGIAPEYKDIWGNTQRATEKTRLALLKALGALDEHDDLDAAARVKQAQKWRRVLPPVAVFRVEQVPYRMRLHFRESDEHA